jgi:hypothetical protein
VGGEGSNNLVTCTQQKKNRINSANIVMILRRFIFDSILTFKIIKIIAGCLIIKSSDILTQKNEDINLKKRYLLLLTSS